MVTCEAMLLVTVVAILEMIVGMKYGIVTKLIITPTFLSEPFSKSVRNLASCIYT